MPSVFRGPRQSGKAKIFNISGGTGGTGGKGGANGGSGGVGEGPRVKLRIVAGKTITNINKNYSAVPAVPSSNSFPGLHILEGSMSEGFRTIPLGDIDLQREIQLDNDSGLVRLRRLYSAKIHAEGTNLAIALYHGNGAEDEWRQDIKKYMAVRHPNVVQLYGTASYGNMHAAVFHDGSQFLDRYKDSHLLTVYIYAYMDMESRAVRDYLGTIFEHFVSEVDCTFFIRRSTGQFCADLVPSGEYLPGDFVPGLPTWRGLRFLARENSDAAIIDSLTLDQYHSICDSQFPVPRSMSISPSVTVNIGSVLHRPLDDTFHGAAEIAWLPNTELLLDPSWRSFGHWSRFGELMADGWTCLSSNDIMGMRAWVRFSKSAAKFWLSQANHIFTTLQISSNFQDYVVVNEIHFELSISASEGDIPPGFLFLCPPKHFQTGNCSFKWPDYPAYWSLDPSGIDQLTPEDAADLGFPSFRLSARIRGGSWDASVYAGLRQFQKAKGLDPDSQDVARHLDHDLYQLSGLFARIDDEYSEDGDNTSHWSLDEEFDDESDSIPINHGE
ncbi:hypothetical protein MSAN_00306200 [Mycena sanguinolenta]|uniref:Protein kinase domain-containing protein n=1 Tax=Mycena sanguinolenta TaxID=230812 RepID=A0A8H6ZB19_9AGAR|nr:hypothetical protein MSAN_00306200 [Mycena sanguinolenta]